MQKNASGRWISVTKSLPACFLCSAYLLKLKKLKRTTLFFLKNPKVFASSLTGDCAITNSGSSFPNTTSVFCRISSGMTYGVNFASIYCASKPVTGVSGSLHTSCVNPSGIPSIIIHSIGRSVMATICELYSCNISTALGESISSVIFFPIFSITLRMFLFLLGDVASLSICFIPTNESSELIFLPIIGSRK